MCRGKGNLRNGSCSCNGPWRQRADVIARGRAPCCHGSSKITRLLVAVRHTGALGYAALQTQLLASWRNGLRLRELPFVRSEGRGGRAQTTSDAALPCDGNSFALSCSASSRAS